MSRVLGGADSGGESRENSAGKGALGVPVQGIYGRLKTSGTAYFHESFMIFI